MFIQVVVYLICKKFHQIGLVRSSLIKHPKDLNRKNAYRRILEIKKNYQLVLCFGLLLCDQTVGPCGTDGTSKESCLDLIETIYKLSQAFPKLYFIVRFKIMEGINQIIPKDLKIKIKQAQNFEITQNLKEQNSYTMAALADIIIGKQTSIMEEAMACGKKVIFYDSENYLTAFNYILGNINR